MGERGITSGFILNRINYNHMDRIIRLVHSKIHVSYNLISAHMQLAPNYYYHLNFRKWLKSAISLVVIMGLTWIIGVLIVEVKELVPLAYIYTIMVAFQGLFIFIIFVVLSKRVREAYAKCWREKVNESDILSRYFGPMSTLKSKSKNGSISSKVATAFSTANPTVSKQSNTMIMNTVAMECCWL